jgi:hypothetical protein
VVARSVQFIRGLRTWSSVSFFFLLLAGYSGDAADEANETDSKSGVSDWADVTTIHVLNTASGPASCVHQSHTIRALNVPSGVDLSLTTRPDKEVRYIIQQWEIAIHHCPTNIHSPTLLKNNGVETESRRNNQPLIEVWDTPLWRPFVFFSLCTANELVSWVWKDVDTNRQDDLMHMEMELTLPH